MKINMLRELFFGNRPVRLNQICTKPLSLGFRDENAEYEVCRLQLLGAGLDEDVLRDMDPDDRVAVLERASLDPYDYIYLAC